MTRYKMSVCQGKKNVELGCKPVKNNKQRPMKWKIIKTNLLEIEILQRGSSFPKEKLVHFVHILPCVSVTFP